MGKTRDDQSDTVAFLSNPKSYGVDAPVKVHQTHGSFVFLAGEHAYKLKRAVKFPYMDYSTPDRRREMCEHELVVNKRMAPALYESVRSVVKDRAGWHLGPPDDDNAVDWVVVMRRFDQADLFEERRKAGRLDNSHMFDLAAVIAEFHRGAPTSHSFGGAAGIRGVVDENVDILQSIALELSPESQILTYAALSDSCLRNLRSILGLRRQTGFVRRCHGDLHLNNICMFGGKPTLFDAIEFADSFSYIDVMYDLAFTLMDLDFHGMRDHANALLNRYLECTGDYAGLATLPLFLASRAAIRAHVAIASQGATSNLAAARLLESAIAYLRPDEPQLIVVGGLSGTGKSVLARSMAQAVGRCPGAVVLRSDVIRKAMFDVPQHQPLDEGAYSRSASAEVYDRLIDIAATTLRSGHSVIADAVFGHYLERRRIETLALDAGVKLHAIWLTAPRNVLEERIAHRRGDVSDATVKVLAEQLATVSVPDHWRKISAVGAISTVLAEAEKSIASASELAI